MTRARPLWQNAAWNLVGTLGGMVVAFVLAPFLIRWIGVEEYGFFLVLSSIAGLMGIVSFGLNEATLRYVAMYNARHDDVGVRRVLGATLTYYIGAGVVILLLLVAFAPTLFAALNAPSIPVSRGAYLVRLTGLSFFFRFVAGPYLSVPQALLRFDVLTRVNVAENVARGVGSIAVVLAGGGLQGLVVLGTVVSAGFLVMSRMAAVTVFPAVAGWPRGSLAGLRETFGFGAVTFLAQLVGLAWQYSDRLLLGHFVDTKAVAYFAVPQDLVLRALGLIVSLGAVLFPRFSGDEDAAVRSSLFLRSTSLFVCCSTLLFVPMAVLIGDFLRLWVSADFATHSTGVAVVLAASCTVRGAFISYEALFKGLGKPQYYLAVVCLSSSTILLLDLALIPRLGLAGAGIAFLVAPLWGVAALLWTLKRLLGLPAIKTALVIVGGPVGIGVLCLIGGHWLRSCLRPSIGWIELLVTAGGITLTTLLALWAYEARVKEEHSPLGYVRSVVRSMLTGKEGVWPA